jgi:hypothetical protein
MAHVTKWGCFEAFFKLIPTDEIGTYSFSSLTKHPMTKAIRSKNSSARGERKYGEASTLTRDGSLGSYVTPDITLAVLPALAPGAVV